MKHFLLIYDFAADFVSRRGPFRAEHLELARASAERGELQLAGALADEPLGLLLFKAASAEPAERFAQSDPYVMNGVVTSYRVREWTTVVGRDALTKV